MNRCRDEIGVSEDRLKSERWIEVGLSSLALPLQEPELDPVLELGTCEQFRQLILSLQSTPGFGGGHDGLEDHQPGAFRRQGALRAHRSVANGGKDALDRVRR